MENKEFSFTICLECKGNGKKRKRLGKKGQLRYQMACHQFEKTKREGASPVRPKRTYYTCLNCNGSGLIHSAHHPIADKENYPHVAIIGAGIGGVALAVACLHRAIPFTLYERDSGFDTRSQGFGLTLQQASNAIKGLGLSSLNQGVNSNLHIVHTIEGKVIFKWGMRMLMPSDIKTTPKRINMHIARQ